MSRNRRVQNSQLQMWLGFVGFFAGMAVLSVAVTVVMRRPLDPIGLVVAVVLVVVFLLMLRRYRSRR